MALLDVPDELRTEEICLEAVKQNGMVLQFLHIKLKTVEVCLEAVKSSGRALEYVSESLKTAEVCLEAVKSRGLVLKDVPERLKTAEMCFHAVRKHGDMLISGYRRRPCSSARSVFQARTSSPRSALSTSQGPLSARPAVSHVHSLLDHVPLVTDINAQRVEKHHRIQRFQGAAPPFVHKSFGLNPLL